MKDLFKKIAKHLLFVSLILLFSCEKNLYEEPLKKEIPKFSVETKEVTNNSEVISKLRKKFPTKLKTSSYARGSGTLLVLQGDFGKVRLDNVLKVAKANDISYTFEIDETVKSSNVYLNLVIDKKDNIWLYKVDKIVQQYKDNPINSERLVRYKLNPDLTEQSSTPCDTIIFPPFQPDPTGSSTTNGGGSTGNWQNTPPSGGFFPPFIFTPPGGSTSGDSSTSGGGIENVVSAIASAIGDAWNWLVELFHSPPCGCHKYSNVVIVDVPNGPCDEGGTISIIPQSPVLDKIYELNELLGNQLKYEDKNYFYYTDGRYLDYFLDLAQNPPTNYDYYNALPYLITHLRTTGDYDYVEWSNNYMINNPSVTWVKFKNWFLAKKEGNEANGLIDLNDITSTPQNLPSFDDFLLAFPSHLDSTAQQVYTAVGGDVLTKYNQGARNTCALRISRGLNYSGVTIPNIPNVTVKGADNKYYFLVAKSLLTWMKSTFGTPTGSNHLTTADGGDNGINFPDLLNGKQGIYIMVPINPTQFEASGHADMFWDGDCDGGCYFNPIGGIKDIYFWELN